MMRMIGDGFLLNSNSMGAPGIEEVRWLNPLRPDTNITLRTTVIETRVSRSRPEMGFVHLMCEILDDAGTQIMTLKAPLILAVRETKPS
jgi:acyl dehydratase